MLDDLYPVALARGARDPRLTVEHVDAPGLARLLSEPAGVTRGKLAAPGWLPVVLREGETHRRAASVLAVWALVVDLDHGADWSEVTRAIQAAGVQAYAHTTWSHRPDAHRLRVVCPFDTPCPVRHWGRVWRAGAAWASTWGGAVDEQCKDPARLYFLPAVDAHDPAACAAFRAVAVEGPPVSWRRLALDWSEPDPPPALVRASRPRPGAGSMRLDSIATGRRRYVEAAIRAIVERVATAQEGQRNAQLNAGAYALGRFVGGGVLDEAEARRLMDAAGRAAGLDGREVGRTTDSGLTAGMEAPWQWRT